MIDGDEVTEGSHQIVHLHHHFGAALPRTVEWHRTAQAVIGGRAEQRHEAVLEALWDNLQGNVGARDGQWRMLCRLLYDADTPRLGDRVDDIGHSPQTGLKRAGWHSVRRIGQEGASGCLGCDLLRCALRQHPSVVHDDGMVAALGLVEIRRADDDGEMFVAHELEDDVPQLAAGQRVDADGWFIEQQELW